MHTFQTRTGSTFKTERFMQAPKPSHGHEWRIDRDCIWKEQASSQQLENSHRSKQPK